MGIIEMASKQTAKHKLLFLDGVYTSGKNGTYVRFRRIKAPTSKELTQLTHTIARRIAHFLERQGLLEQDGEGAWLTSSAGDEEVQAAIHHLLGSSITRYRFAFLLRPCVSCVRRLGPALSHCGRPATGAQGIYLTNLA